MLELNETLLPTTQGSSSPISNSGYFMAIVQSFQTAHTSRFKHRRRLLQRRFSSLFGMAHSVPATPSYSNSFDAGFRFHVHYKAALPTVSQTVTVLPNTRLFSSLESSKVFVVIKRKKLQVSLLKAGQCRDEYPRGIEDPSHVYSTAHCRSLCIAQLFSAQCGCVPLEFSVDEGCFFL